MNIFSNKESSPADYNSTQKDYLMGNQSTKVPNIRKLTSRQAFAKSCLEIHSTDFDKVDEARTTRLRPRLANLTNIGGMVPRDDIILKSSERYSMVLLDN